MQHTPNVDQQRVIVLDDPADLELAIESAPDAEVVVVPYADVAIRERFASSSVRILTAEDLKIDVAETEAKRAARELIDQIWALPVGDETLDQVMRYRGVSLRNLAHAWLVIPLVDQLTSLIALDSLWTNHTPQQILLPRASGVWSHAARHLAASRDISVKTLRNVPPRAPIWPPVRRSVTQFVPDWFRWYRERRAADAELTQLTLRANRVIPSEQVDILVPVHFGGEARALLPIIERIRRDDQQSIVVGADAWGQAVSVFEKAKIEYQPLWDVVNWSEAVSRVREARRDLSATWYSATTSQEADRVRCRGVSVLRLMRDRWKVFVRNSLNHNSLRQYLLWIEMMDAALITWCPKVVVVADEAMGVNAAVIALAKRRRIATLHVQHGAILDHPKHRRGETDIITVGGDAVKRFLVNLGTQPGQIVVTGYPQFDPLDDREKLAAEPVRERLGLPHDKKLVLFTMLSGAGVTPLHEVVTGVREVVDAFRKLGLQYSYVFKRHPADRGDLLSQMGVDVQSLGAVSTIDEPIHPLLMAADVVVTQMSTTGTEALLLGKPLVIVNLSGRPDTIPYVEYGAALGVYRSGETTNALERALTDDGVRRRLTEGRDRFTRDFAYRPEQSSTECIVREIYKLVHAE